MIMLVRYLQDNGAKSNSNEDALWIQTSQGILSGSLACSLAHQWNCIRLCVLLFNE
jgi:hypothetical protein